jgi:hypothetical protein
MRALFPEPEQTARRPVVLTAPKQPDLEPSILWRVLQKLMVVRLSYQEYLRFDLGSLRSRRPMRLLRVWALAA